MFSSVQLLCVLENGVSSSLLSAGCGTCFVLIDTQKGNFEPLILLTATLTAIARYLSITHMLKTYTEGLAE